MNRDNPMWNAEEQLLGDTQLSDEDELLGVDWANVGRQAMGVNHMVGKTLLTAFGAPGVAQLMEDAEAKQGVLPDWATKSVSVSSPNFVVLAKDTARPLVIKGATKVMVFGGTRFDGNGYVPGQPFGSTFSFGVDAPTRVEITVRVDPKDVMSEGRKTSYTDIKQILFLGGSESSNATVQAASDAGGGGIAGMISANKMKTPDAKSKVSGLIDEMIGFFGRNLKGSNHMDNEMSEILGELGCGDDAEVSLVNGDDQGYVSIISGDDGWTEIVGDDYVLGSSVVGATLPAKRPVRNGFVLKKTPAGNAVASMAPNKVKKGDHLSSIRNARDVGARAVSVGTKLLDALKNAKKTTVLGAAQLRRPVPGRKVARLTPSEMKKLADKAVSAGKDLLKYADKYATLTDTKAKKLATGVAVVQKKMNKVPKQASVRVAPGMRAGAASKATTASRVMPSSALRANTATPARSSLLTRVTGDFEFESPVHSEYEVMGLEMERDLLGSAFEVLGAELIAEGYEVLGDDGGYEVLGANGFEVLGAPTDPDPLHPGYLIDGSVDPSAGDYASVDSSTGMPVSADPYAGVDPYADPTSQLGSPPTVAPPLQAGVDYSPDPYPDGVDWNTYSALPAGAVIYDGSRAFDQDSEATVGSLNRFLYDGAVKASPNGKNPMGTNPLGGQDSGFQMNKDGWQTYDHDSGGSGYSSPNSGEMSDLSAASQRNFWGPLVGRPGTQWSGLRYLADGSKRWFWFRDKAPSWATAADDTLRLNQAIADYKTQLTALKAQQAQAAAADQLAAQQSADMQRQQALEDQAQQAQIDAEQREAEHQATMQSTFDEQAQASQSAYDQSQAQLESQQAQMYADLENKQYQSQLAAQQAAQMQLLQYAAEHPELAAQNPELFQSPMMSDGSEYGADAYSEGYDTGDAATNELLSEGNAQDYAQDEQDAAMMDAEG